MAALALNPEYDETKDLKISGDQISTQPELANTAASSNENEKGIKKWLGSSEHTTVRGMKSRRSFLIHHQITDPS